MQQETAHDGSFDQNDVYFWLFSEDPQAAFARARGDIPTDILKTVSEQERGKILALLYERLRRGLFCDIDMQALLFWKDREAVLLLKTMLKAYEARRGSFWNRKKSGNFSYEIQTLKRTIAALSEK